MGGKKKEEIWEESIEFMHYLWNERKREKNEIEGLQEMKP